MTGRDRRAAAWNRSVGVASSARSSNTEFGLKMEGASKVDRARGEGVSGDSQSQSRVCLRSAQKHVAVELRIVRIRGVRPRPYFCPALRNSSRARGERRDAISASHSDEVLLLTLDHAMEAHSLATWTHVHMTSYTMWAVPQTQKGI